MKLFCSKVYATGLLKSRYLFSESLCKYKYPAWSLGGKVKTAFIIGKKKYIQAGILPLESQMGADAEGKGERGNYRTGLTLPFFLLFQQLHISTVSQWFIMVQTIKLCQKPQHKLPSALTWKQILFDIQGPKPSWKSGKKITHISLNKKIQTIQTLKHIY